MEINYRGLPKESSGKHRFFLEIQTKQMIDKLIALSVNLVYDSVVISLMTTLALLQIERPI